MSTKSRLDALERADKTPGGYSLTYLRDAEVLDVVIHDGKEPPDVLHMTRAEYENWKRTRSGDWLCITVQYGEQSENGKIQA